MLPRTIVAGLMCMSFLVGCQRPATSTAPPPAVPGTASETKSAREGAQPGGAQVRLQIGDWAQVQQLVAARRGKVVVLDLWATW